MKDILMILCGGSGERLTPITKYYSKPLVPVNDQKGSQESNVQHIIDKVWNRRDLSHVILIVSPKYEKDYVNEAKKLEQIYNIPILPVVNQQALTTNNITSFLLGLQTICSLDIEFFKGLIVVDGDSYIKNENFLDFNENVSSLFFTINKGDDNEWSVIINKAGKVIKFNKHASENCLSGITYISYTDFITIHYNLIIQKPEIDYNEYWESIIEMYLPILSFKPQPIPDDSVIEYDTIIELMSINGIKDTLTLIPGVTYVSDKSIGGMTNNNYLITYFDEKYVVRIPGFGSDKYTHRVAEAEMYKYLKGTDITPDVIYLGPLKLTKYLDDYKPWDPSVRDQLPNIIGILSKLHKYTKEINDSEIYPILDPVTEIRNYDLIRAHAEKHSGQKREMPEIYDRLFKWLSKQKFSVNCIIHADLVNTNFLCSGNRVYLIDFEYTSRSNYYWDLGSLLSEMCLVCDDLKQDTTLIELAKKIVFLYNQDTDYKEIIKWCAITHYVWSSWGYARDAMGSNELAYAEKRLHECERCLNILKEEF